MFELHITCTKDITRLDLDFADGTSTVIENRPVENRPVDNREQDIPVNTKMTSNKQTVIEKPKVPDIPTERPVKIDNILNDLQF